MVDAAWTAHAPVLYSYVMCVVWSGCEARTFVDGTTELPRQGSRTREQDFTLRYDTVVAPAYN